MSPDDKPLVWLYGDVKTPPLSHEARLEMGFLLRLLQQGQSIGLPHSRPMPDIGTRCHELRVRDQNKNWRLIYRTDEDAIVIVQVFNKTTRTTPKLVIDNCQRRLRDYDAIG